MLIENIYNKINDSEIFRFYFGEFDLSKSYPSVFRTDNKPSTGFFIGRGGRIIYNDLTTGEKLDAVNFVMKLYDISYPVAIRKIKEDLELITKDGSPNLQRKQFVREVLEKEEVEISILPRPFTDLDIAYFNRYNISRYELTKNDVFSIKGVFMKGKLFRYSDKELRIAYRLMKGGKAYFKLYSPNLTTYKWISSIPLNCPFGIDTLPKRDTRLIVTKSLKDKIVLNKFFTDVIALQNESLAAFTEEDINKLKRDYDEIIINFDADNPGIKASTAYKERYGFNSFCIPQEIYEEYKVKDYSDYVEQFGLLQLKKLLRWQKLY
jgi:5S rRNA maturation endonuclease (ribonuclease M5)